ncbi:KTSC domain-containing protein [Cetobacterium sp. SF1]|uniref:KTSC domain-containing protein n=1 Tax=Cetobacterium sp. SF1 TaxID=3417654 RepID=UPI003CF50778
MFLKVNLFGIKTISYHKPSKILTICFNSGLCCNYKYVPEDIFNNFIEEFNVTNKKAHVLNQYKKILKDYPVELVDL